MLESVSVAERLLAAGLIRDAAQRLRQARELLPDGLRRDAALLCDAARALAEQAEAAVRAEAEANRQQLADDLRERARRQRETREGTASLRENTERLRAVARGRARPGSFPVGGVRIHAAAVEAALAGRRAVLDPQDRLYLLARIEALGGPGAIDLEQLAAALGTTIHILEHEYRRYRQGLGEAQDDHR